MRDHGSIGLFWEWCFGEKFGSKCFGLFLFCFCLVWGKKVTSAQDFGWQSKGEDQFKSWFPFFPYLVVTILYCLDICLVRRPFCIIISFSSDLWSGIFFVFFWCLTGNFPFLLFSSNIWSRTFFFFSFLPIFDRELLFLFVFFRGRGWKSSSWVKVYGELGFWLKACRTAGHDICQSVNLASASGIKRMSHIISMTRG